MRDKGMLKDISLILADWNPIYKYTDSELEDIDVSNLRRAILTRLCKNINHKYMNGINCIYLNYRHQHSDC